MTFQQLQYLLTVDRTGSFSLAAKELFITQSAVSNALAALEKELNCRIFTRSTFGLSLTPEGKQVVSYAKRICENHRLLTTAAKPDKVQLRVNSPSYAPASAAFMRILEEYRGRDDILFSFNDHKNVDFFDRLLHSYTDVAISMSFSVYDPSITEQTRVKKLLREQLCVVPAAIHIGPGHRLYNTEDPQPQDFAEDCMLETAGRATSETGVLLAYVPINKNKVLTCGDAQLRRELLEKGYGYTIGRLPGRTAREKENFRYIPIPGLTYTVAAYTDPIRPMSAEVSRYLELLKEEIHRSLD